MEVTAVKKRSASANAVYFILLFTLVASFTALLFTSEHCEATAVAVISLNMHPVLNGKGEKNAPDAASGKNPGSDAAVAEKSGSAGTGWITENGSTRYLGKDGKAVKDKIITEQGTDYYLGKDGVLVTSSAFIYDGKLLNADENGALSSGSGWQQLDDGWYFAGENGTLLTDTLKDKDGKRVYLGEDGRMLTTAFYTVGDTLFFAEADGSAHTGEGWMELDGKTYYCDNSGHFSHSEYITVDENKYFMDRTGAKIDGTPYFDQYLGCTDLIGYMESHFNDYYFKTPFRGIGQYEEHPEELIKPYGEYGEDGGMNCTGFISSLVKNSGGDLGKVEEMGLEGSYGAADSYLYLGLRKLIRYDKYDTVQDFLDSGNARKGDIIYIMPSKEDDEDADCHLGVFWGDTPSENKMWSQTFYALCSVTEITYIYDIGCIYVFPLARE